MFRSLAIAASGLSAQRQRMETIAQNIANADVTSGPGGAPYKRRTVMVETATAANAPFGASVPPGIAGTVAGSAGAFGPTSFAATAGDAPRSIQVPVLPMDGAPAIDGQQYGVTVTDIAEDQGEGKLVYQPGHPDADANGYVRTPDINTTQEMVNLLDAKRIYEANASVFQVAKSMLRASLDI
jgi:flagellar basal-body rod protein FlgC